MEYDNVVQDIYDVPLSCFSKYIKYLSYRVFLLYSIKRIGPCSVAVNLQPSDVLGSVNKLKENNDVLIQLCSRLPCLKWCFRPCVVKYNHPFMFYLRNEVLYKCAALYCCNILPVLSPASKDCEFTN